MRPPGGPLLWDLLGDPSYMRPPGGPSYVAFRWISFMRPPCDPLLWGLHVDPYCGTSRCNTVIRRDRLKNEDGVVHLVSTWPFPVLNLNDIEIPFGDYLHRETPRSECIADLIIKGLFYRKVKFCRLQMLVLPKDTREGRLHQLDLFVAVPVIQLSVCSHTCPAYLPILHLASSEQ